MKNQRSIRHTLLGSALLLASSGAWATTCNFSADNPTGNNPVVATMPLQRATISVGRDLRDGATLYRQTFRASPSMRITCLSSVTTIRGVYQLASTPLPLIPGRPEFGGNVYETDVPGIGVALWFAGNGFPYTRTFNNCGGSTSNCNWHDNGAFDISFIKTGPISGGVIRADKLPSMSRTWVTGNSLKNLEVNFSGSITVVVPTCTTPDVNVPLGSHRVTDLKGIGNGTPWRDFEIRLNNCPAISGYINGTDTNTPVWNSDGTSTPGTPTGHPVTYKLTPQSGAIDAAEGIARLSASRPGNAPAATGIGVQIANRSNEPRPLGSFLPGVTMRPGQLGGQSMSIPLRARYIQVADTMTPGPANAAVEFLLNYQ